MTEQDFLIFLEKLWRKGKVQQVSATIDGMGSQNQAYLHGHALLPKDYDKLGEEDIIKMGSLLFKKSIKHKTKEAIMMILSHLPSEIALNLLKTYNLNPDKGLEFFAEMALEECAMWNE